MAKKPSPNSPEFLQEELEKEITVNKTLYIAVGVIILVGVIGYSVFNSQSKKSMNIKLNKIQNFAKGFELLKDKKIALDDIYTNFKKLDATLIKDVSMHPSTLELSQKLIGELKMEKAIEVVEMSVDSSDKNLSWYLLNLHLASLYEDKGDFAKATTTYESLLKTSYKFNEAKVYFELGRVYKEMGNIVKAKENLSTVVAQFPNEEMASFAKILLRELK
jgi:tetratricopeptide (TPR) repeat protein